MNLNNTTNISIENLSQSDNNLSVTNTSVVSETKTSSQPALTAFINKTSFLTQFTAAQFTSTDHFEPLPFFDSSLFDEKEASLVFLKDTKINVRIEAKRRSKRYIVHYYLYYLHICYVLVSSFIYFKVNPAHT